jgi:hypothetical protein
VDTPPQGSLVPATPVRAAPVRRPAWPDRAGRRRPSGQEYVDPRHPVPAIVWMWGIAFVASVTGLIVLRLVTEETAVVQAVDRALRDLLGGSPARRRLAEGLGDVAAALGYRALWVPVAVVLAWFAQWRQLMVYLGTVSVIAALGQAAGGDAAFARAVRRGVTGSAADVMVPTWPVIVLAAVITATLLALAPAGPARRRGWVLVGAGLVATGVG